MTVTLQQRYQSSISIGSSHLQVGSTHTTNCGSDAYIMLPFTCQIRSYLDPAAAPMHLMMYKDRGSVIDQPATAAAGRSRAWRGLVCLCSSLWHTSGRMRPVRHYEVRGPVDSVTRASASSSSLMILSYSLVIGDLGARWTRQCHCAHPLKSNLLEFPPSGSVIHSQTLRYLPSQGWYVPIGY